ncbi:hypothetical protein DH2020_016876 [Rehmannia glutinosa]|uniref:GDP-L-galactose phosphorylase n=1 Tax=Rehmannia glutinosa TaxID=99300 RepID=A0ABR0WQX6_REHGL
MNDFLYRDFFGLRRRTQGRKGVDITDFLRANRAVIHVRAVRRKGCVSESNPSPHGGRGALPSEGGSPSDLLFLAGGDLYCSIIRFKNLSALLRELDNLSAFNEKQGVIPGKYGFIAQLNEGRHLKKRPTEFRVDKVLQPFDENKFNFTKVGQDEVLFQFEPSENNDAQFFPNAPIDIDNSPSVVAINVSPIEYGHVLLIPRILECLPQRIDRESFSLALHMAVEAGNPYFRLGYNSLGAFATINHLHFQAYYLAMPFPIERAPSKKITTTSGGVKISYILNYPVRGLVFECGNTMEDLSNVVSDSCICLQENNIPYNMLIADSGKRIFLFPQALGEVSAEILDTQVNPAVWEISGHMVLKRKDDYEGASEGNAWRLLAEVSLSEERLEEVKELIFESICCLIVENKVVTETTIEESAVTPQSHEDMDALKGSHHAICLV